MAITSNSKGLKYEETIVLSLFSIKTVDINKLQIRRKQMDLKIQAHTEYN